MKLKMRSRVKLSFTISLLCLLHVISLSSAQREDDLNVDEAVRLSETAAAKAEDLSGTIP